MSSARFVGRPTIASVSPSTTVIYQFHDDVLLVLVVAVRHRRGLATLTPRSSLSGTGASSLSDDAGQNGHPDRGSSP